MRPLLKLRQSCSDVSSFDSFSCLSAKSRVVSCYLYALRYTPEDDRAGADNTIRAKCDAGKNRDPSPIQTLFPIITR
nr:MAG TPA_asm: hypothetical protein [Caudoviricetes sp.]